MCEDSRYHFQFDGYIRFVVASPGRLLWRILSNSSPTFLNMTKLQRHALPVLFLKNGLFLGMTLEHKYETSSRKQQDEIDHGSMTETSTSNVVLVKSSILNSMRPRFRSKLI